MLAITPLTVCVRTSVYHTYIVVYADIMSPPVCLQKTPLFLACRSGHLAAAEVLMENGADVTAVDNLTQFNCLDIAVDNGHKYVCVLSMYVYCPMYLCCKLCLCEYVYTHATVLR